MTYRFTGFFARPVGPQPVPLLPGAVWREIATPFSGVGVRLSGSDNRLLTQSEAEALARQFGLDAAECWVFLNYVCWGGSIDFVYGLGSRDGVPFGPVKETALDAVKTAYTGLMEQFGVSAAVALQFEPFRRGYWGEI
jgi:hypothetical protein